jgi:hypothetical protein
LSEFRQGGKVADMARRKTTVYLESELLTAVKVVAAGTDRRDYEVIEEALRTYMARPETANARTRLRELLDRVAERDPLPDDAALALADEEVHAHRAKRTRRR